MSRLGLAAQLALVALMCAGCSLLFNPKGPDAEGDAGAGDGGIVGSIWPDRVFEGQKQVPLMVQGQGFVAGETEIEMTWPFEVELACDDRTAVSADGTLAARLLCVPTMTDRGSASLSSVVEVDVVGPGAAVADVVVVNFLEEILDVSDLPRSQDALEPYYAEVDVQANAPRLSLVGSKPYVLRSYGRIRFKSVTIEGAGSSEAPGPGGWPGASVRTQPGGSPPGSSGGGCPTNGSTIVGNGAAHASPRDPMEGCGAAYGVAALVENDPGWTLAREGGSGGSAGGGTDGTGQRGGGGGGVVVLHSDEVLDLVDRARVVVVGGVGASGVGASDCPGGGGAGGAILLSAPEVLLATDSLHVDGGAAGSNNISMCALSNASGTGSPGRVRVDGKLALSSPSELLPFYGPTLSAGESATWLPIVETASCDAVPVYLRGSGAAFLTVDGDDRGEQQPGDFLLDLPPGQSRACACLFEGKPSDMAAEACNCNDVVCLEQ